MKSEISFEDFSESTINREVSIDVSSMFELNLALRDQSKLEKKYLKAAVQSNKKVNELNLLLEIRVAEFMDSVRSSGLGGKKIPPSAWQEVRRTAPLMDQRCRDLRKDLIEAMSEAEWLNGLYGRIINKGYRLKYLAIIEHGSLKMEGGHSYKSLDERIEDASDSLSFSANDL